jgi:hypothetical protein
MFPAYTAYMQEEYYLTVTLLFLTTTTVLFHGTRWEYFFYLDLIAILNFIGYVAYLSCWMTPRQLHAAWFPVVFGIYTYFIGQHYKLFSWDPDWNTQMFWHGFMHIFSAYSFIVFLDRQQKF